MVTEKKCCATCGTDQIVKKGSNQVGSRKYKCKSCSFGGVLESSGKFEAFKEMVVCDAQERTWGIRMYQYPQLDNPLSNRHN
jgi:transposase-like protein